MQHQCVIVAALITLVLGCTKKQEPSVPIQASAPRPSPATAPLLATAPTAPADPVAALAAKLANGAPGDRAKAAEAIGALGDKGKPATPALCAAMLDKDDDVKLAAADALKKVRPDLHPLAMELAVGKDVFATEAAVNTLRQLGPKGRDAWPVVVEHLQRIKTLRDKPPVGVLPVQQDGRMQSGIWFLEKSGAGEEGPAFDLLLELAGNPDVRTNASSVLAACSALGVIGEKRQDLRAKILPVLLGAMAQFTKGNVTDPIVALGKLGPDAKEAVPALRKLTLHEDAGVRKAAGDALARIEVGK